MPDQHQQIAILIFANSSQEELKHKYFAYGQQLFDHFNEKTVREVRKTGFPYALYSEKEQHGDSFGERFVNAIEDLFKKGYQKIITIGNDSPDLKASHLIDAGHKLMDNTIVLGPSMDGGFYLMGIDVSCFEKGTFIQLPWQTAQLAKSLIRKITTFGVTIQLLRRLKDINKLQDLQYFLSRINHVTTLFKAILLLVFSCVYNAFLYKAKSVVSSINYILFNKGSPGLISFL